MAKGTIYEHRQPTEVELAWLTGIWEGEGSWIYRKSRTRTYSNGKVYTESPYLKMQIQMTDKDVMERVSEIMDGRKITYTHTPAARAAGQKPIWALSLQGEVAFLWTELMKPFLGNRRKEKFEFIMEQVNATNYQVA